MIHFNCYPGGKRKILTMSYDDGQIYDRDLVPIFNKYGIRGTFHLNSGLFGDSKHINADEVKNLYAGHEVSCHTVRHPDLTFVPNHSAVDEILSDRRELEALCGYPVRGMSWPYGTYNDDAVAAAKQCGIVYSRTVAATKKFQLPQNFLTWHPTCHHRDCLEMAELFEQPRRPLFYVWGHSFEFNRENNWDMIEEFCKRMGGRDDIWYATNIEIYDYITAQKMLQITADNKSIYNPTLTDVWVVADGEAVKIPSGITVEL